MAKQTKPFSYQSKHKDQLVSRALDYISNIHEARLTDADMYTAWPQGKVFSHKSMVYALSNAGSSHSGRLQVYQQTTQDGTEWTTSAPRLSLAAGEEVNWPQGVTAWGAGSDGTNIWMVARYRRQSDESQSKNVLLKSTNDGASYVPVLDPIPLVDSNGYTPVLYHSFAVLPNGNIAFGYHMYDGEVGIFQINPTTLEWSKGIMFTKEQMAGTPTLVEATLFSMYNGRVIGGLRSQNLATQQPKIWYSDDNCQTFTFKDAVGVPALSPISMTTQGNNMYFFYCDRYRRSNSNVALTGNAVLSMRVGTIGQAFNLEWDDMEEVALAEVPGIYNDAGPSGTGVQDCASRGTNIVVVFSANVGQNVAKADCFSLTLDFSAAKANRFYKTATDLVTAQRSTVSPANYKYGSFNMVTYGGVNAAYRLDGEVVVNREASGAIRYGSVGAGGSVLTNFSNGPAPAYISVEAQSTNLLVGAYSGKATFRAGRGGEGYASLVLDRDTKEATLSNPNNTGGVGLQGNGVIKANANWQHPLRLAGGSGGDAYLWISGSGNLMFKYHADQPTSDTDGVIHDGPNGGVLRLLSYTVATLPASAPNGTTVFASNGRKVGEGAGAGTGVPVYRSGSTWYTYNDAAVTA